MTLLEDQLTIALREAVDDVRLAPDLLTRASRAADRATLVRRGATAAAATGLAAAVTVGVATARDHGQRPVAAPRATASAAAGPGSTPEPGRPRLQLVAALQATAATTYRVHLRNDATSARGTVQYADFTGVVDSARGLATGTNRVSGEVQQVRVVGGTAYRSSGDGRWVGRPGTLADALVLDGRGSSSWSASDGSTADPATLLARLRERGTVTVADSGGGVAVYRVQYEVPGDGSAAAHAVTGAVRVDTRTGLVSLIRTYTTVTGAHPEVADGDALVFALDVTFADFGVAVDVAPPPAALVDRPGTGVAPQGGATPSPSPTSR